jgi:hypothetical protein
LEWMPAPGIGLCVSIFFKVVPLCSFKFYKLWSLLWKFISESHNPPGLPPMQPKFFLGLTWRKQILIQSFSSLHKQLKKNWLLPSTLNPPVSKQGSSLMLPGVCRHSPASPWVLWGVLDSWLFGGGCFSL